MMIGKSLQKIRQYPILILLAISMLIGLFTFRDYGLSWDEPLFYDYAKAIGYAYSPSDWFSGNFNLENAYGPSASDHGNRGPAYILLAREPESLLEWLGLDSASAWHLINFLTLQLGIYLFYRLSKRWMNEPAALISTALFAWQPLLWGHTFINPKDPPFLVFFVGAMCFGFEMVDELAQTGKYKTQKLLLAAFFLGIATSIRVLGPLAGLLVCIYGLSKATNATALIWIKNLALYTAITILIAPHQTGLDFIFYRHHHCSDSSQAQKPPPLGPRTSLVHLSSLLRFTSQAAHVRCLSPFSIHPPADLRHRGVGTRKTIYMDQTTVGKRISCLGYFPSIHYRHHTTASL